MQDIHDTYISEFKKWGEPVLRKNGFNVEVLMINGSSNSTKILVERDPDSQYILHFATNQLDYADGVLVSKTKNRDFNWEELILPRTELSDTSKKYAYMGTDLQADIERIVQDIIILKREE